MNDQIKDFVERHREEFDHLDAPAFDMERFKKVSGQSVKAEVKTIKFFNQSKWLMAASFILVAATAWLIYSTQTQITNGKQIKGAAISKHKSLKTENNALAEQNVKKEVPDKIAEIKIPKQEKLSKKPVIINNNEEYHELKDSSSASVRLLAILKIEKKNKVDNKTLNMLSETLNHDGNTNVRLAALGILQKYGTDKHAATLLVNSLNKQDDPIVQLGLVSYLGKIKNAEIGEKLYALANNPETFAAVRDEAYSALLNQDKL